MVGKHSGLVRNVKLREGKEFKYNQVSHCEHETSPHVTKHEYIPEGLE